MPAALTRKDRFFYWFLWAKWPLDKPLNEEAVVAAAKRFKLTPEQAVALTQDERQWARVEAKRASRISGVPVPESTPERVSGARMTNLLTYHRRMASQIRKAGLLP